MLLEAKILFTIAEWFFSERKYKGSFWDACLIGSCFTRLSASYMGVFGLGKFMSQLYNFLYESCIIIED